MNHIHHVLGLVHYPCLDKAGELQATSVFNVDVHDISRITCTYGFDAYHVIHPVQAQRDMVAAITGFWKTEKANLKNADRSEALSRTHVSESIAATQAWIKENLSHEVTTVVTSAIDRPGSLTFDQMKMNMHVDPDRERTYLWLFGTGYGLSEDVMASADLCVEPIYGPTGYNHLSVRAAVAIILDRLFHADGPVDE